MNELSGYPYIEVEITKVGALLDPDDLRQASAFVTDQGITDLFMVSHGWNNDSDEARRLYRDLFKSIRSIDDAKVVDLGDRKIGVLGILWPSKKFADKDLIPGGGAVSMGGDQAEDIVAARLDIFAKVLGDSEAGAEIQAVRSTIAKLDASPAARKLFSDKVRALLPPNHDSSDDGSDRFFRVPAEELFDRLKAPLFPQMPRASGGAAGGGAGEATGLGDWFSGVKAAARRILNYATYYIMKARAGTVGAGGVREVLAAVKEQAPETKVHLVGHSFGGRVVTAASKALGDATGPKPSTMSLLQAAFSHNGFAKNFKAGEDGYFRSVMAGSVIAGPVILTHTHNDTANGMAYPLASRLAGQNAAAIGGPDDQFGAIGANGAQHTPEAYSGNLLGVGTPGYSFHEGRLSIKCVNNMRYVVNVVNMVFSGVSHIAISRNSKHFETKKYRCL